MGKRIFKSLTLLGAMFLSFSISSCNNTPKKPDGGKPDGGEPATYTGITLNQTSLIMMVGDSFTLVPTLDIENKDDTLVWSSSKEDVASVNNGVVLALKEGASIISVSTSDNKYSASCNVTVQTDEIRVNSVSLNYETLSLEIGKSATLIATIDPITASNQNISWSSSNEEVATVDKGTVTALSEGETNIKVVSEDGNKEATCVVSVYEEKPEDTYVPDETNSDILIIKEEGEYTLEQSYKQIYVDAEDAKVTINLNGQTIENNENSPIYVKTCDSIDISATKGKTSYIKDTRSIYTQEDEEQGKGAIYVVDGDLKLKGKGTLSINANYYNGIHGKDDVEIKNLTLNVNAVNHGIRGNDSITIESGTINVVCGGDGLHSDNSDISSKGKQRGNVTVSGGTININSWGDALSAAYNAVLEEASEDTPLSFTAKTNKYSSYDGEVIDTSDSTLYLKMESSTYSNGGYTYAAYINNAWYKATFKETQSSGGPGGGPGGPGGPGGWGGKSYYIYSLDKPTSATSFTLYRFQGSNVTSFSLDNYNAKSDAKAFNSAYDMVTISVSGNKISFGNWSNYSSGNTNSADISAKGIKANNEVYISGGTFDIKTYDDAIHANNDNSLENGETPLGNIHISGGSMTLDASDDAIHADYKLNISGGEINVTSAYEGLEGNVINLSGGTAYVYATDDGVNATSGKETPAINVSGGYFDVGVPSNGDTDGIDSNGTYTQTGGVMIIKGPGSASGNNFGAAALDSEGAVKITSGTLIVFGGIEKTPNSSVTRTLCSSSTVSVGTHTVSFTSESYETVLKTSTNGCVVYSNLGTASLK